MVTIKTRGEEMRFYIGSNMVAGMAVAVAGWKPSILEALGSAPVGWACIATRKGESVRLVFRDEFGIESVQVVLPPDSVHGEIVAAVSRNLGELQIPISGGQAKEFIRRPRLRELGTNEG